jgi:hypothetical protein
MIQLVTVLDEEGVEKMVDQMKQFATAVAHIL